MIKTILPYIFLALFLLAGCQSNGEINHSNDSYLVPPPPSPTLTIEGTNIPFRLGTYSWSENGHGTTYDSVSPPELLKDTDPVTVQSGGKLQIDFYNKPLTLEAGLWESNGAKFSKVKDSLLTLPKEKGVYIYVIYATWREGNATYVFKIQII